MKKITISFLFIFLISGSIQAQILKKGSYIYKSDLDLFVGTWVWKSGTSSFKVILVKDVVYVPTIDARLDVVIGWHEYIKDGDVVESSLQNVGKSFDESTINGTTSPDGVLSLNFHSINREKRMKAAFVLDPRKDNRASWTLTFAEEFTLLFDEESKEKEKQKKLRVANKELIPTSVEWKMKKVKQN